MVLAADIDYRLGIDEACENVRRWLRAEIDRRLREVAKKETVEVVCGVCGEPTDVSTGHALKFQAGNVPAPMCFACRRPERNAEAQAAALVFVEQLGEEAREFAGALAALS